MRDLDTVYFKEDYTVNGHTNVHPPSQYHPLPLLLLSPQDLPFPLPSTSSPPPLLSPSNLAESNPEGGLVHLLRMQYILHALFVRKPSVRQFSSGLQSTIATTELGECHVLRESCMVIVCYVCVKTRSFQTNSELNADQE